MRISLFSLLLPLQLFESMPPVTEEISNSLPESHVYTNHVHPWEEIVEYVCK